MPASSLSWHIPMAGDPRLLRLALAQVGLATVVAALVLAVAAPRDWLGIALMGLIPLAIFMAYRRWNAYRRSLAGSDNIRIDAEGVHWLDASGTEQTFSREAITGFHIGRDAETLRPLPALTLHLTGGFESQPIELHPPATPETVRHMLAEVWRIVEHQRPPQPFDGGDYDLAVPVYSECHEEFQEWHWEGTKDELSRFFEQFAATADELPLPPPGAKPAGRIIFARRREPMRLRLAHAPTPHFEPGAIAAPADMLREIARSAARALASATDAGDAKFDVSLGSKNVWTFHVHVRSP